MLRFLLHNEKGVMGLVLSQLALVIAAGILLAAICSLVFFNDWQKTAELQHIASGFTTIVEGVDTYFVENTTTFFFSKKNYPYTVDLSTEYVIVETFGTFGNVLSLKERLIARPWPQYTGVSWVGRHGLHDFLLSQFGESGTSTDPISTGDIDDAQNYLANAWNENVSLFASNPYWVDVNVGVFIDKAYVYYEGGEKQTFIFVYQ
ncbi:MAG: hypothetical protein JW771_05710 [Candidatus Thermoplasmatota archaeon]|nr:hypothetical protein [Candidatus Thermoplasmatota archaeon]